MMDIEQLSKSQIVLLTMLVSFMTSIATGIVTVSLMDQAPPAITQTVSKVIERTIEKSAPEQTAAAATPQTIEKTVYVKAADATAQAVDAASPSLVRLISSDTDNPSFIAIGIVLDKTGLIVTDSAALGERADASIILPGSKVARVFVSARDIKTGLAYLSPGTTTPASWKPATLSKAHPTLGEAIIGLSGRSATRLSVGVITALSNLLAENKDGVQVIETNISSDDILPGSPIIDTDGSIIGVSTGASRASSERGFVTSSAITIGPSVKETAKTATQ